MSGVKGEPPIEVVYRAIGSALRPIRKYERIEVEPAEDGVFAAKYRVTMGAGEDRWEETRWRKVLGREPVAGVFIDDRHGWQRLSETWPDPDLGDPELPLELAMRLADYITTLEPLRGR